MTTLHVYYGREDDLQHCSVCGCAEGELALDCPGKRQSELTRNALYAGLIDFRDGKWVPGIYQQAVVRAMSGAAVATGRNADSREILVRFCHRQLLVASMEGRGEIAVSDLLLLDRGGLTRVANTLWGICSSDARALLLNHEHPHVRSCAELAK